jgi:hypothetical protein
MLIQRVMLNLIQHPLLNQGIPDQVRNDALKPDQVRNDAPQPDQVRNDDAAQLIKRDFYINNLFRRALMYESCNLLINFVWYSILGIANKLYHINSSQNVNQ